MRKGLVRKIVDLFLEFLAKQTDVESLEEVTKGMAGSYFDRWYKNKVWGCSSDTHSRKLSLEKFFSFLASQKGIFNQTVLSKNKFDKLKREYNKKNKEKR
jgi:hypothetical protein